MDFNLQAYQADHLLHLSAKPERRLSILENARHRWLEMDGVVQSAMSLSQPEHLCLPHQQCIADLLPTTASRVLELGLGGGDLTRHLGARWPEARHDCVDLDAEILTLFQQFFQDASQRSPRLHHADALHFLLQSQDAYDLVLLDLPMGQLPGLPCKPVRHWLALRCCPPGRRPRPRCALPPCSPTRTFAPT